MNYIEEAKRTESDAFSIAVADRLAHRPRLLHAAMGLVTESGEFLDNFKKHIYYGKPFDATNVVEEIGDVLWYCAIALDCVGMSFEQCMERNIHKLRTRYPEKFNQTDAIDRDLDAERLALEAEGAGR